MSRIAALIVAAGKGERAGGAVPKQFQSLLEQPVLRRSVAAFAAVPEIDVIQIVAAKERWPETSAAIAGQEILPFAEGGETRHGLFSFDYERLSRETLQIERKTILRLRNERVINDEVLRRIQRDIDLTEARLHRPGD